MWPLNGDGVPFYYESSPSEYSVKLTCQGCGKDTFVVWDFHPGPVEKLDSPDDEVSFTKNVKTDPQLYLAVKHMVGQAINSGIADYDELMRQAEQAYGAQFDMEELRPLFRTAWIELHQ
jgi:hypothetical protein